MRYHRFLLFIFVFLASYLLVGCGSGGSMTPETPPAANPETTNLPTGYPGASLLIEGEAPYPVALEQADANAQESLQLGQFKSLEEIIPEAGRASVVGVVLDRITQQIPPESILYLGNMKYTETGFPVVALNRQEAPFYILPKNGLFIFEDIEPGEYALVFFTPDYSFLIEDEEENSVTFTVKEGDVLDIGSLTIELP